jgi:carbonic anhydrase
MMPPTCNTRDNARNERNKRNETNERYEQTIDVGGIMPVDLIYFVLDSCFFPCAENKLWVGMVCR